MLLDPSRFANPIAEIVELSPSDFTPLQDFDRLNSWGMQQEDPFYPNPLENLPHGNGAIDPTVAGGDHSSFVGLDPFFATLLNADPDPHPISDIDPGQIAFHLFRFDLADDLLRVHGISKKVAVDHCRVFLGCMGSVIMPVLLFSQRFSNSYGFPMDPHVSVESERHQHFDIFP